MRKFYRWALLMLVLSVLIFPAVSAVLAQNGTPEDGVISVQIQEASGVPWYVGVLILIAVWTAFTIFKNKHQATQKKTVIYSTC